MTGPPAAGTIVGAAGSHLRTLTWPSSGKPRARLVLVHGLSEHVGRYSHVARHLADRGIWVFGFDLRGHGGSEGRRGYLRSFDLLVEDLHRAVEAAEAGLPVGGPLLLYGHSLGGLVVLRFLQNRHLTVEGAALSAPWLGMATPLPGWMRLCATLLLRIAPDAPLTNPRLRPDILTSDPAMQDAFLRDPLVHHRMSARFLSEVERAQELALEQDVDPDVPLLVLAPTEDRLVDTALTLRWAEALGAARVTVERLEGARHEPHNDVGRERAIELLTGWLLSRATDH